MPDTSDHATPPAEGPRPDTAAADAPQPGIDSTTRFDARRTVSLAFLASGIAHDLANPLGAMLAFASYLASDPRVPPDLREDARLLRTEADRTHRMVRTLLEFARDRPPTTGPVAIDAVVDEVLELEAYVLADVTVERDVAEDLPAVEADPSRLRHLVMVLSVDAIRSLGGRSATGLLRMAAVAVDDGNAVELSIETRPAQPGDGSPEAASAPPLRGAGAGPEAGWDADAGAMADAASQAAAFGAALRVVAAPHGNRLVLRLPVSGAVPRPTGPAQPATAEPARAAGPDEHSSERADEHPMVLVCDDEEPIRTLLVRLLERGGFRTLQAASSVEALDLLGRAAVDVVLTDHHMTGMSGIELFQRATAELPHLRSRFVLMSGDPHADELVDFADGTGVTILAKPFEMQAIAATIREVARA